MFAACVKKEAQISPIHPHWDQHRIVHHSDSHRLSGQAARHHEQQEEQRFGHHLGLIATTGIIDLKS
jgi:hypothetical protein